MREDTKTNVVIVMATCSRRRAPFGIRYEEMERGLWAATWAFRVKESYGKKERCDRNSIQGSIQVLPDYPGCPYCESQGIFLCGRCNKVGCWDGRSTEVTCPNCNNRGTLSGTITELNAGADR